MYGRVLPGGLDEGRQAVLAALYTLSRRFQALLGGLDEERQAVLAALYTLTGYGGLVLARLLGSLVTSSLQGAKCLSVGWGLWLEKWPQAVLAALDTLLGFEGS